MPWRWMLAMDQAVSICDRLKANHCCSLWNLLEKESARSQCAKLHSSTSLQKNEINICLPGIHSNTANSYQEPFKPLLSASILSASVNRRQFSYHLSTCHQVTCDLKARSSQKDRTVLFNGLRCTRLPHWVPKESMKSRHVMSCHVIGGYLMLTHGVSSEMQKFSRSAEFAVHPFSKFCIQISRSSQFLCAFNASMPVSRWASTTTSASIPQLKRTRHPCD